MGFERKVAGVEESHFCRNVVVERLRTASQKEGVIFAPSRQEWWLVFAEIGLEFRIHGDVVLIIAQEFELHFISARTRQTEIIRPIPRMEIREATAKPVR